MSRDAMPWSGPQPEDGWEKDVWLMARRTALLYLHFAQTAVEELGQKRGEELIREAVTRYGRDCGSEAAEAVRQMGLEPIPENMGEAPDLPSRGWHTETVVGADGTEQQRLLLCPLAIVFQERGEEELGRLYCLVDEAKMEGFNCRYECYHSHNVLDGDEFCQLVTREKPGE